MPASPRKHGRTLVQFRPRLDVLEDRFLLDAYQFTLIDVPGAIGTDLYGINNAGQIVGSYADSFRYHGFLRDANGSYTTIDPPGAVADDASGINSAGQIVGRYWDASDNSHGFLRDVDGRYTTLDVPGAASTWAFGINNVGQIVGLWSGPNVHGFVRAMNGSYTTFDVPGVVWTEAHGINNSGQIVGLYFDAGRGYGFVRDVDGRYTTIDVPGSTAAYGINAFGQIVGPYVDGSHTYSFLRHEDGSYTMLAVLEAGATEAFGINSAGEIVGTYVFGGVHGFLATPEANSAAMFGISTSTNNSVAGSPFTITVTALDSSGNTATGYDGTVHFTSSDPQAISRMGLPSDYTFTAADQGAHTFANVTLFTAGDQTIVATDTMMSGVSGMATISVNSAAASRLIVSGFPSPTIAGSGELFTVTAKDSFGNTATDYQGTVTFRSTDRQAVLPIGYTFTMADQGTQEFAASLRTAGNQRITATETNNPAISGMQTGILILPAPLERFSIIGPQTIGAGQPLALIVTARDHYNNVVTTYQGTIRFSSTDEQATLPGIYQYIGSDAGTHAFTGLVLRTAGASDVSVMDTIDGQTGGVTVTVTPAAADHLLFLQQPTDTSAGQTISAVTVAIVDPFGNIETSDNTDTITLAIGNNPNGGTLSGTLTMTVTAGIATFSDLSIDQLGANYTLLALADGLTSAESDPFNITM